MVLAFPGAASGVSEAAPLTSAGGTGLVALVRFRYFPVFGLGFGACGFGLGVLCRGMGFTSRPPLEYRRAWLT